MKQSDVNWKTEEILRQFEKLPDISLPADWQERVLTRVQHRESRAFVRNRVAPTALLMAAFILVNLGILLTAISGSFRQDSDRSSDLKTVSKEFLVNPLAITD